LRWDDVIRVVLSMPPHRDLAISKGLVPHPSEAGFKRRLLAEPRGQRGDWELVVDGRAVHVREYDSHYLVHWDRAPFVPRCSLSFFDHSSRLGTSTSPTPHGLSAWAHERPSGPTARGPHLR